MKKVLLTTLALTATIGAAIGMAPATALALEKDQSSTAFQKTASVTPYEATDPRYQSEGNSAEINNKKVEEGIDQNKGRRFGRRRFGRRRFGRRGFGRRGFGRRGFGRRR